MRDKILDIVEEDNKSKKETKRSITLSVGASICFFIAIVILYINPAEHTLFKNNYDYASIVFFTFGIILNWISIYFVFKSFKTKEKDSTYRNTSIFLNSIPAIVQILIIIIVAFEIISST